MAEWVQVFEKAVLDMKDEGLQVELDHLGWHLFEKSNLTTERQERLLGHTEGEYEYRAVRRGLLKLFPDTVILQEKRQDPMGRGGGKGAPGKPSQKFGGRWGNRGRDHRTGRFQAHAAEEEQDEEQGEPEEEQDYDQDEGEDVSQAFDREMDALAAMVDECADTIDENDLEDLRELTDQTHEGLVTIKETHARLREKAKYRGYQRGGGASSSSRAPPPKAFGPRPPRGRAGDMADKKRK